VSPGRRRRKLDILSARGIRTALASDAPNIRADIVVECTGKPESFELARKRVRPRGTIILKSSYVGQVSTDLASIAGNCRHPTRNCV
jgi:threonine dehydrogenase-like Zn-dependent dehydrogenase